MSKKINKTISDIFKEFNKLNINYAVLRNFGNLKKLSSDIDILYDGNISKIKKILTRIARVNKWSHLIYDSNKSKNFSNISKIYIFYFFDLSNLSFIQVDFFNSLKIFTTPYFNFQISNKKELAQGNIKIIPKNISYTYHIFQIASLNFNNKKNLKKIEKYRKSFLSLDKKEIYKKNFYFEELIIKYVIKYLRQKDYKNLKRIIFTYKILILLTYYIKNPFNSFNIFIRIYEFTLLYFFQPWSTSMKIKTLNKIDKIKIIKFFNILKKKYIINDWNFKKNLNLMQKLSYCERRNLIVKIDDKEIKNNGKIEKRFFESFISNKKIIYSLKIKKRNDKKYINI